MQIYTCSDSGRHCDLLLLLVRRRFMPPRPTSASGQTDLGAILPRPKCCSRRPSERGATPNLACSLRVGGVSDLSWTDSRTRVCRLIRHPSAQTSFPFEERRIGHKIVCHPRLMQGNLPIGPPKACRTHLQLLFASDEQDGGETALGVGEGSSDLGQQWPIGTLLT